MELHMIYAALPMREQTEKFLDPKIFVDLDTYTGDKG